MSGDATMSSSLGLTFRNLDVTVLAWNRRGGELAPTAPGAAQKPGQVTSRLLFSLRCQACVVQERILEFRAAGRGGQGACWPSGSPLVRNSERAPSSPLFSLPGRADPPVISVHAQVLVHFCSPVPEEVKRFLWLVPED